MNQHSPWLEALFTIGPAAFNGLLAQRSAARETHRAGGETETEADVPAAWRIPRNDRGVAASGRPPENTPATAPAPTTPPGPTVTPPSPSPSEPQVSTPTAPRLVFKRTLQPWDGAAPAETGSPPPTSSPPIPAGPPPSPEATMHHSPSADPTPPPQLELDFSPRPKAPEPVDAPSASANAGGPPQQLDMLLASVARLVNDVVGQAAGQAVTDALSRLEQSHARELTALAERFEAALERQDARTRELLERQDARLREVLASQARAHADELRAVLREVASARTEERPTCDGAPFLEACQELQETLRLGFGELRSALDRNNHNLLKLRTPPAPIAAPRAPEPEALEPAAPAAPGPAPALQPRAGPARSPPQREDRATSQRLFDALHDDETATDHAIEDAPQRPLRYRPPDDDAETAYAQEASP